MMSMSHWNDDMGRRNADSRHLNGRVIEAEYQPCSRPR